MASQIWTSIPYLLVRCICWILLFGAALLDGLRHIHVKSRGRKLYAGVIIVLASMVVQDVLLLLYSLTKSGAVFSVYIFFTDGADSLFTALLLVIAAGFCITRDTLGPYKNAAIGIPTLYFVTILVVDYIMDAIRGRDAFTVANRDTSGQGVHVEMNEVQRLLLIICAVVNLVTLMAAWITVFDNIAKERELLEMPEQNVYGTMESGQVPGLAARNGGVEVTGHAVLPPVDVVSLDDNEIAANMYGNVTNDDLDGPKTVEEKVSKAAKILLLRQFSYGVITYVVATAVVVLLPIFVTSAPGEQAVRVVLVMQNIVLLIFLGGLAWIFRLRADSQYLLMEEEGLDGGAAGEIRTELGVISPEEGPEQGSGSPHSMQNYSLDDPEDQPHVPTHPAPAQKLQSATREVATNGDSSNGHATVDLAAEREDVKMMKGLEKSDA